MKANIISLTSLSGSMKDVQFQLKGCYFCLFLCSEHSPCSCTCCFSSWHVRGEQGTCAGLPGWGRGFGGGRCRAGPLNIALGFLYQWFSLGASTTGLGLVEQWTGVGHQFPQEEVVEELEMEEMEGMLVTPSNRQLELRLEPPGTPRSSCILPDA